MSHTVTGVDEATASTVLLTATLGDDADLFSSGGAPSAPSGMDSFPDLSKRAPSYASRLRKELTFSSISSE